MREASWDIAVATASQAFARLDSERVSLSDSVGRFLARDHQSLCDLPAFETSSMDGWAICGQTPWRIVGEVATGKKSDRPIYESECMAIATGGVIPVGTTAVIPWEKANHADGLVTGQIETGANIRPAGMESRKGDVLAKSGSKVNPPLAGLLAASGHDFLEVTRQPKVAIFFLGDELIHSGVPIDGAIRDALGPALPTFVNAYGVQVIRTTFVKDDLVQLSKEIESSLENIDLIITTGGTADGPRDYIKPAISNLNGELLIDCVKVRPGYHVLLASVPKNSRNIPLLALPGNPQSALAALSSIGRPLFSSLLGGPQINLLEIELGDSEKTPDGFSRLVPGTLAGNKFTNSDYLGSAMLRGVAHSEGFALVSPGDNPKGTIAHWLPFPFNSI